MADLLLVARTIITIIIIRTVAHTERERERERESGGDTER